MFKKMILVIIAIIATSSVCANEPEIIWSVDPGYGISQIQISSDDKFIYTAGGLYRLRKWDAAKGEVVLEIGDTITGAGLEEISLNEELDMIAVTNGAGQTRIYSTETGVQLKFIDIPHEEGIVAIWKAQFTPDGKYLIALAFRSLDVNGVFIFDVDNWELVNFIPADGTDGASLFDISPLGNYLILGSGYHGTGDNRPKNRILYFIDLNTLEYTPKRINHDVDILAITISKDESLIAIGDNNGLVKVYNFSSLELYTEMKFGNNKWAPAEDLLFSNDSNFLIFSSTAIHKMIIKNIENDFTYEFGPITARQFSLSHNSDFLVVATSDNYDPFYRGLFVLMTDFLSSVTPKVEFGIKTLYPNPANSLIYIPLDQFLNDNIKVNIIDISGNLIDNVYVGYVIEDNKIISYNCKKLSSGSYIVNIQSKNNQRSIKLIKE